MTGDATEVEELSDSTCWALLRSATVGRMALHGAGDEIEIFPVNFIVDDASVVFKTGPGTKLALTDRHRRSAFEVDDLDFYEGTSWSVVLRGVPHVIEDRDEVIEALDRRIRPWQTGHKATFIRLTPDVVTGRRFRVDPNHTDVHR